MVCTDARTFDGFTLVLTESDLDFKVDNARRRKSECLEDTIECSATLVIQLKCWEDEGISGTTSIIE
jgi:hypothetical protein